MKMMIASDLHGSAYYTAKIKEIFEEERPDRLILLGDLLYHGPRNPLPRDYAPMETAEILNSMKDSILAVRGNCDSEVDQVVLDFPIGADYMVWYDQGSMIFTTHGHLFHGKKRPHLGRRDILLQGHTHIPVIESRGRFVRLNPGSAALPKEGFEPSCMIYEDGVFEIRTLEGRTMMSYDLAAGEF
ncbi:MAG: phosphodiesterase [Clostridia bacterium]|nr:phosphodiesterase [Clostridia bacterium]